MKTFLLLKASAFLRIIHIAALFFVIMIASCNTPADESPKLTPDPNLPKKQKSCESAFIDKYKKLCKNAPALVFTNPDFIARKDFSHQYMEFSIWLPLSKDKNEKIYMKNGKIYVGSTIAFVTYHLNSSKITAALSCLQWGICNGLYSYGDLVKICAQNSPKDTSAGKTDNASRLNYLRKSLLLILAQNIDSKPVQKAALKIARNYLEDVLANQQTGAGDSRNYKLGEKPPIPTVQERILAYNALTVLCLYGYQENLGLIKKLQLSHYGFISSMSKLAYQNCSQSSPFKTSKQQANFFRKIQPGNKLNHPISDIKNN